VAPAQDLPDWSVVLRLHLYAGGEVHLLYVILAFPLPFRRILYSFLFRLATTDANKKSKQGP
jgi:hypothetical protein